MAVKQMEGIKEITGCEICGNSQLLSALNLGNHPLCDDLIPVDSPEECKEYPIEILFCQICRTAHQRFQVAKQILFPNSYHYRSRFTEDVLDGMHSLVDVCETYFKTLQGKTILDIGCNDGSLLNFFREKKCKTIGIEPTLAYLDAKESGHVVYDSFFSKDVASTILKNHDYPDIITFTNVFAHIEDLAEVLSSLKILLKPHTLLVIENHYLGSILQGNQIDTFYQEHPRTYSYTSFEFIARILGLSLLNVEFPKRYGGNIRIFMSNNPALKNKNKLNQSEIHEQENNFLSAFNKLNNKISSWQIKKLKEINCYIDSYGKLQAKAFPGRAAILVKLLNLNENHLHAVYEKPHSFKINHYVPGTRIPIKSDADLFLPANNSKLLLNLAWHIPNEIRKYMSERGYLGKIIDILNPEDFVLDQMQIA